MNGNRKSFEENCVGENKLRPKLFGYRQLEVSNEDPNHQQIQRR